MHQADRFVANFIGETNFLEGVVETVDGIRAVVRLDGGTSLAAQARSGTATGARVTLVVRPEHADLAAAGAGALAGTLETIVYSGNDTQYHVRLGDGGLFVVRNQSRRGGDGGLAAGHSVGIALQAEAAQVLRD